MTTASAGSAGGGIGNISYNGTTASNSIFPGMGTITYSNAPNTPNLTQATSQVTINYPIVGGTSVATAYASANLASGTLAVQGTGNQIGGGAANADPSAMLVDTLTFNIPNATSSTVTNVAVSFQLTGSATSNGSAYGFVRSSGMVFQDAHITEGYDTSDKPQDYIIENDGWVSMQIASLTEDLVSFNGVYALTGPNPQVTVHLLLSVNCQAGNCDYSHAGATFSMTVPPGVTYTSASGVFLSQAAVTGVVNGGGFQPGIVPGSLGTILGSNFSSSIETWNVVKGQLPTSLNNVSVTVGGQPAYINYVSPQQINFVVPNVAPGKQPLVVTTSAGTTATATATVSAFGPAFFFWPNNQVVATRTDFSPAAASGTFSDTATTPAKPGDTIILWGTGFGPTSPTVQQGIETPADTIYNTSTLPAVTIDNISATVLSAVLAPGFAGLYQVAIQVPASLGNGNWPVTATIGGVSSPTGAVLAVDQ